MFWTYIHPWQNVRGLDLTELINWQISCHPRRLFDKLSPAFWSWSWFLVNCHGHNVLLMVIVIGKELVTGLIGIWWCSPFDAARSVGESVHGHGHCNQCDFASQLADLKRHIEIHHREKLRLLKTHHLLIGRNRAQEKLQRSGAVKKLRVFLLDCVAITVAHSSIAISPLRWNINKGRSLAFTHCGKGDVCKCSGSNS